MAKLGGLTPLFTMNGVRAYIEDKAKEYEDRVLQVLMYHGEQFVNLARQTDTYTDRTGNLRSSIGYVILKNGAVVAESWQRADKGTGGNRGIIEGQDLADEISASYPRGYVLIGVAGMKYAAAVEAKGYDVITGSAPDEQEVLRLLNEALSSDS